MRSLMALFTGLVPLGRLLGYGMEEPQQP
jgi:hypothetical protein